jgi:hypothetical protein
VAALRVVLDRILVHDLAAAAHLRLDHGRKF